MSSLRNALAFAVVTAALTGGSALGLAAEKTHYGYGATPTDAQIAGWNIDVRGDDGAGLPPGHGSVDDGAEIFSQQCAACHGTFGEGVDRFPKLAGGEGTLTAERPEETVGSYWPFAATLYDYINRAMPMPSPHTLKPDEIYALSAYILNLNNIVPNDFVADKDSLAKVRMPNHDSFTWKDPRPDTQAQTCMENCADPNKMKITSTAEGGSLTPRTTGPLDDMRPN